MKKIKKRSFMQQFREWERMGSTLRPTMDKRAINHFGIKLVYWFDKYDAVRHKFRRSNHVITRIYIRAEAAKRFDDWPKQNLKLTKEWRTWAN